MKREIFEVVEAAKALQVQLAPTQANPRCVRVGGDRADFPERLWRLAKALEAFDRSGASVLEGPSASAPQDPTMDAARLRVALDGVFRWMRSSGLDVSQPYGLVAEAMGVPAQKEKAAKAYKPVPKFAPSGFKKTMRPKALLNLEPAPGEKVTLAGLAQKEFQAQATDAIMGAASTARRRA